MNLHAWKRIAPFLLLATVAAAGGCKKKGRNLPFGDPCDSDDDCSSSICLFLDERATKGWCTKECDMDENDCPEGKACLTLASHAGRSGVPVCGEAPPIPMDGMGGSPPPGAPPGSTPGTAIPVPPGMKMRLPGAITPGAAEGPTGAGP